jgi:hypothetical protein
MSREGGVDCTIVFDGREFRNLELQLRRMDVGVGTFFSNVVMFFIILTTAIKLLAPFLLIAILVVA